ncbi:RNA-directed DNA polymerase [Filimonas lacunae]|uniref:RNA-directed DNA polymerase n=1 Tax=Filimonas lacunae TaxID=477680 RepID=A0A173MMQ6_9BACT|nr:reverse transcriptase domain-containing protein [Filimonas lacunae]BAV08681.1 retron-type RNA-directed DNA polymerase [Filimonas lacunae]SIS59869.1 RNA-directed DNA polymerase [Filimonas lacunae]
MADNRLTRQQIYDRIRSSSKESYILSEMKRLGFWSVKDGASAVSEALINKEASLEKELNQLLAQNRKFNNREAVLKEMRLKRMAEARQKREENKKKREQKRYEKAEAWRARKQQEILYLGEGVSAGLHYTDTNEALLCEKELPVITTEKQLAEYMGIALQELHFLAFSRRVSTVNHYRKFYLPKKSGGKRLIAAPMPRLKNSQYWILNNILARIPVHAAANGFVADKSIVTNARPHLDKEVVINIDVKDFFPSIHFARVKGVFVKLGYSEKIATVLSLLCTEPVTQEISIDGRNYFVQKGQRVLPQGAPGSPVITNILCHHLDQRMQGVAAKHQYTYTRYADDITFSGSENTLHAQALLWRIKKIVQEEGFTVHPDKVHVMRKGARQEVTGVVVNKQLGIQREKLRQFRALLHNIKVKGWENAQWGNGNIISSILGYINYIKMIDPAKAAVFQQQVNVLFQQPGFSAIQQQVQPQASAAATTHDPTTNPQPAPGKGTEGDENWWKVV